MAEKQPNRRVLFAQSNPKIWSTLVAAVFPLAGIAVGAALILSGWRP